MYPPPYVQPPIYEVFDSKTGAIFYRTRMLWAAKLLTWLGSSFCDYAREGEGHT